MKRPVPEEEGTQDIARKLPQEILTAVTSAR
jgi:hypothetical protein